MKYIIPSRLLITGTGEVLENYGVSVKGESIEKIAPNQDLLTMKGDYKILHTEKKILSPGFINTHMHLYGILAHGLRPPHKIRGFLSFLEDFWWPLVEDSLQKEMIGQACKMAALELLESGVTTCFDILEAPKSLPSPLWVQAEVMEELGMRSILSFEATERCGEEIAKKALEENRDFFREYRSHSTISGGMSLHTTFTCSKEYIERAAAMAREDGALLHFHLSESPYEGEYTLKEYSKRPVEVYRDLGILGPHLLVSQGVNLSSCEMDLLEEYRVKLAHVPLSNCEVGGGIAPVPHLLARGIEVGLGTDGFINNFFEVMRGAFLIHKAYLKDPSTMPAHRVYELATSMGAKAIGLEKIGVIKEGDRADLITIAINSPTPVTRENIYEQLILYHNPQDVKEVLVHGSLIKEGGELRGMDMEREREETKRGARLLWGDGPWT